MDIGHFRSDINKKHLSFQKPTVPYKNIPPLLHHLNINKRKCLNFIVDVNIIKITSATEAEVRGRRTSIWFTTLKKLTEDMKVLLKMFTQFVETLFVALEFTFVDLLRSINIAKLKQACSHSGKIKTKDDTHKSPLKSNQSIIQLHNSTVTVNKKRQKEQNCTKLCAFKYGRRWARVRQRHLCSLNK